MTRHGRVRDGAIYFDQPLGLPEGVEVEVDIQPLVMARDTADQSLQTSLTDLPFFGMWSDREEMADSIAWVREQREERSQRLNRQD
jgi:hypothetical protein